LFFGFVFCLFCGLCFLLVFFLSSSFLLSLCLQTPALVLFLAVCARVAHANAAVESERERQSSLVLFL